LAAELRACDSATIEARALRPAADLEPRSGSKPLKVLQDPEGRRWLFKTASTALAAAECASFQLRALGRRPCVAARPFELEIAELGLVSGVLKPFVSFDTHDQLPTDTQAWTALQRAVILREHAWEWLLADLDSNRGQYALFGPERYPVKLDWDRAFSSLEFDPPSRFDKYKVILPNARSFLYVDWLESKVALEFDSLIEEAHHIARMPAERVRHTLLEYAARSGLDKSQAQSFVQVVLERQRRGPREFEKFVVALHRERSSLSIGESRDLGASLRAGAVHAWRWWQLVLDGLFRGPVGDAGRASLRAWRAHSARVQARGT
jgi:hypothetical protein